MLRSITLFSALSFGLMAAAPAHAGFEWIPPAEKPAPAPAAAPMMPSIPPGPSAQDMLQGGMDMMQAAPDPYAQAGMMPPQQPYYAPVYAPMPQQQPMYVPTYPPAAAGYYAGAQAYPNPVPPAPMPVSAGGLSINPYPMVQAGYAPSMMNTGSVEGAMMAESRNLNPLQLGNGLSTGGKPRPLTPSQPVPVQQQPAMMGGGYPQPLMQDAGGLSAMPGGPVTPLPGAQMGAPAYAPYAAPAVMQAPIAPPPAPVMAAPLSPPPMMDRARADSAYPAGAPTSTLRPPSASSARTIPAAVPPGGGRFEDAVGFGKDLPLALALSQVIPGDFALFFETAVDAEMNVSWQGGKPWDQVLQEMLAPLGLRAVIQPNLVMIHSA